uniref:Fibronectin type-III domain-containing protein n=1 Tax=Leptobrachium leishanense TaxID=445787 RepID=A0A8C5MK79_9ANUR
MWHSSGQCFSAPVRDMLLQLLLHSFLSPRHEGVRRAEPACAAASYPGHPITRSCCQLKTSIGTMDTTVIEIPSLGRPFSLGMLYDCRSDKLIPGVTFWNDNLILTDVESKPQENTSFELIVSDSISDKATALDISVSLKASFLCGLINVGGSATYINDKKSSSQHARVTLKYSRTTRFDQLTMNRLGTQNVTYPEGTATHVVTGILYGAQAFFIFDRKVSTSENIQDIQGNLQVMINKIPSVSIEGEGKLKLTDTEKGSVTRFNCTFHGDFALDRNPVTYEEAINTYANLPKLLGPEEEKAVPVKVWLYPLSKLDNRAAKLVREISNNLISKAENILQQMTDVNMHCNDLMRHPVAEIFPDIKRKMHEFRDYCDQFTLVFQKQLAQTLPSIRGGEMEEVALVNILAGKGRSPFAKLHVDGYLSTRRQEMDIVSSYLKVLENLEVLPSEDELSKVVTDPMIDFVVCYNFTSLNEGETYLSDMTNWLPILEKSENEYYRPNTVTPWFKNTDDLRKERKYVRAFQEFTQANASREDTRYIISCTPDPKNPGVSIHLYEVGILVCDSFLPPGKPSPPVTVSISHDMVTLSLKPSDFGEEFVAGYSIDYRKQDENWKTHRTENKDPELNLTGLQANKTYQVRYSSVCKVGLSAASDITVMKTLPASPPEIITCTSEPTCLHLLWKEPKVIGEGVTITEYKVEYKEKGKQDNPTWLETKTGKKRKNWDIAGLKPKTSYAIRVQAVCGDLGTSAPSDEIEALTSEKQKL